MYLAKKVTGFSCCVFIAEKFCISSCFHGDGVGAFPKVAPSLVLQRRRWHIFENLHLPPFRWSQSIFRKVALPLTLSSVAMETDPQYTAERFHLKTEPECHQLCQITGT